MYSHYLGDEGVAGMGWILGHLVDGTQEEVIRIPYADDSIHKLPDSVSDEGAVGLVLPQPNR